MISKTARIAAALLVVLTLAGCAAEPPAAGRDGASRVEREMKPEPLAAGDAVDAATAEKVNTDQSEMLTAYPVGDDFVIVDWAEPLPEKVRLQVEENLRAASPDYGAIEPHNGAADESGLLFRNALKIEREQLGFDIPVLSCVLSFAHGAYGDGWFERIWVIAYSGPQGTQSSFAEGLEKVQYWASAYKGRSYVVINNLGCEQ